MFLASFKNLAGDWGFDHSFMIQLSIIKGFSVYNLMIYKNIFFHNIKNRCYW
jgi:hypothetical protein